MYLRHSQLTKYFNPCTHKEYNLIGYIIPKLVHYFNPRTHEECNRYIDGQPFPCLNISIHALTRSATVHSDLVIKWLAKFQSMHSRGVQPSVGSLPRMPAADFNPCTHEECNAKVVYLFCLLFFISIHALTRSATAIFE